jgi:DNA polymerase
MPSLPADPRLRDWLAYFAEIGFGELVVERPAGPWAQPPQRRAGAGAAGIAARAGADGGAAAVAERLAALAAIVAECRECRLCERRQRTVFGSGSAAARLMLIGEGPGAEEDRQGLPFVGKAGDLLTRIIGAIGLRRDEVYIANVVKCRPPENRDPMPDEVAACRGYLEAQIDLIRPAVIVLLGRVAAQTMLGNATSIGRLRGRWYAVREVPAMVTYHPAALLRAPELKRPTWDDMQQVRDRLHALAEG